MIYSGWIIRFNGLSLGGKVGLALVGVLCIGGLGGWDGCRGILRLTYFVIRRGERNHEGCLVENVMMSSTFW